LHFSQVYAKLSAITQNPGLGDDDVKIQESAENYLETILILSKKSPNVRSIDIAGELEYTKPSVSVAMKNLRENGCIEMDSDGFITLTDRGRGIAESMYERHTLLSEWLVMLGVDKSVALEDACRIEHVISCESFDAIKKHVLSRRGK
jgi:DtxR family Mn-dependent transcriptional regulator